MKNNIEEILRDLYAIDPSLKEREAEIKEAVTALLEARPDARIDEEFVRSLRAKLEARANLMGARRTGFPRLAVVGVLAVLAMATVAALNIAGPRRGGGPIAVLKGSRVAEVGERAFGSLAGITGGGKDLEVADTKSAAPSLGAPSIGAYGMGGSDATVGAGGGSAAAGIGTAGVAYPEMMPVPYEPTRVEYVYRGEPLELSASVPVYRRIKVSDASAAFADLFSSAKSSLFDFGKLQSAQLESVTLVEDRDFGYQVTFQALEGVLYMGPNWRRWPQMDWGVRCLSAPASGVEGSAPAADMGVKSIAAPCMPQPSEPIEPLSDGELIVIADAFIKEYGFDLSGYGAPEVVSYGREYMLMSDAYVSPSMTVRYPLMVDGAAVVDEGGERAGMYVDIDVRQKRASGLRDLYAQRYERSSYEGETNAERVLEFVKRGGGYYGWYGPEWENMKTIEVGLGTPEVALMRTWNYNQETGESIELLVSALVFPVLSAPDAAQNPYAYVPQRVVVPLVKEILDARLAPPDVPIYPPKPMPLEVGPGQTMPPVESMPGTVVPENKY